jgi:hypothetical protein
MIGSAAGRFAYDAPAPNDLATRRIRETTNP